MGEERRRAERHFFCAQAELLEPRTQVRVPSRISDLSLYGCYLDMMNPFPPDTVVSLKITSGDESFEANSRIVHATPNVGAGAAFLELASKDRDLLERWLRKAAR
jgi:hypothetical protein